jgi:rhodanese-related sulfurtransferase
MTHRRCLAGALLLIALLPFPGCRSTRRDRERPAFRRVSAPVGFEMMRDSPWMLVLDLRTPEAFNGDTGHLYRSLNIPLARLSYDLGKISLWRDETFLVYCDTAQCAEEGMRVLATSGFDDAVLLDGGIDSWIAKGFKTVLPETIAGRRPSGTPADDSVAPGEGGPSSGVEAAAPPPR